MTTRAQIERGELERGVDELLVASSDLSAVLGTLTPLERSNVMGRLPGDVVERLRKHEPPPSDDETISRIHARILGIRVPDDDDPVVYLRRSEILSLLHVVHTLIWEKKTK